MVIGVFYIDFEHAKDMFQICKWPQGSMRKTRYLHSNLHVSQHVSLPRGISGVKYVSPKLRVQGWCASRVRWCTDNDCQDQLQLCLICLICLIYLPCSKTRSWRSIITFSNCGGERLLVLLLLKLYTLWRTNYVSQAKLQIRILKKVWSVTQVRRYRCVKANGGIQVQR